MGTRADARAASPCPQVRGRRRFHRGRHLPRTAADLQDALVRTIDDVRGHEGVECITLSGLDEEAMARVVGVVTARDLDDADQPFVAALTVDGREPLLRQRATPPSRNDRSGGHAGELVAATRPRRLVGADRRPRRDPSAGRTARATGSGRAPRRCGGGSTVRTGRHRRRHRDRGRQPGGAGASRSQPAGGRESDGQWRFVHAFVRAALYDDLSRLGAGRWHKRVAEVLEQDVHTPPASLAHHWSQCSGSNAAAWAALWYRRAGHDAMERLAPEQAASFFERAIEMHDHSGGAADDRSRPWSSARRSGEPASGSTARHSRRRPAKPRDVGRCWIWWVSPA